MIIILQTASGLFNQIDNIYCLYKICKILNIKGCIKSLSTRKTAIGEFYNIEPEILIDMELFLKLNMTTMINFKFIKNDFEKYLDIIPIIHIPHKNFNDDKIIEFFKIYKDENHKYIILLNPFSSVIKIDDEFRYINSCIRPCENLQFLINKTLRNFPNKYNSIHYRYEQDHMKHWNIVSNNPIKGVLESINFNKTHFPIHIATEITYLNENEKEYLRQNYLSKDFMLCNNNIYKNLTFEEKAIIDRELALGSVIFYGNRKSSFSEGINICKNTSNYYI